MCFVNCWMWHFQNNQLLFLYFLLPYLSFSLSPSLSLFLCCLSELELMAEFRCWFSLRILDSETLLPPPCHLLRQIHCSDEQLIYITAAEALFLFHTHASTHPTSRITSDSNLLCVTLQAWDSCLKRNQHTYTPPNDGRLRPHLTLHHLSIIPLSLLSQPSPPPLLFLSKTILHYIMTPMLLCFSRSQFYFGFQFSVPYWHNKNYTFVLPMCKLRK